MLLSHITTVKIGKKVNDHEPQSSVGYCSGGVLIPAKNWFKGKYYVKLACGALGYHVQWQI